MRFEFDNSINDFLKIIVKCAKTCGVNVYFVGGIVRDNMLNKKLCDIDITVDINTLEFVKYLPPEIKVKSLHNDFYTAKVEYNGISFDIASTRTEHYPHSGCLPVVDKVGVDIHKDCLRRDFSINALYSKIDIKDDELNYELIDLVSGVDDIKSKTLRVLHDKSYIDDPTRILRGVNFKHRFGFDFSLKDKELIDNYLSNADISNASYDRILSVFRHVLSDATFKDIIENKYYKIINKSDLAVDFDFISKLKTSSDLYLKIILNEEVAVLSAKNELEIIKNFSKMSNTELLYYYYKTRDNNVSLYQQIKSIKPLISGDDLIQHGFIQGKELGETLKKLHIYKLKNPKCLTNKEQEIEWVLKNKNL